MDETQYWHLQDFLENQRVLVVTLKKTKERVCSHCKRPISTDMRKDSLFCCISCKQMAYYDRKMERLAKEKP